MAMNSGMGRYHLDSCYTTYRGESLVLRPRLCSLAWAPKQLGHPGMKNGGRDFSQALSRIMYSNAVLTSRVYLVTRCMGPIRRIVGRLRKTHYHPRRPKALNPRITTVSIAFPLSFPLDSALSKLVCTLKPLKHKPLNPKPLNP